MLNQLTSNGIKAGTVTNAEYAKKFGYEIKTNHENPANIKGIPSELNLNFW